MLVLGIESSCDDTAAAVVRDGREILSSVVESQAAQHAPFGGVVPEIAGRSHLRRILPVIERALEKAGIELKDIDGLAVTRRPGLIGSLLVGLSAAKAIAFARRLPLVGVHHIEGHAYAATMENEVACPALALVVSGGHTALYRMLGPSDLQPIAQTLDDAAGEAFDKVASMLGLAYPGGPEISKLALKGRRDAIRFPRYSPKKGGVGFSFSGLKTAVLYHLRGQDALAPTPAPEEIENRADIAASFEAAVVDTLVTQTLNAAKEEGFARIVVAGGVACNQHLRERMCLSAEELGMRATFPSPAYCSDNAAMIAGLGYHLLNQEGDASLNLDALAR
ncbi:MAG: tRNA (adenosine(37)-N6)-threonylcarbamoyltransferase complex transferase subunit TsaD [Planctomycetes bacterium]|nr:tRNA (adenosine(37)-N6)-threonylcarbamoyltransferase complex transferase subunit TsaD [Planctomycetota bacterium]